MAGFRAGATTPAAASAAPYATIRAVTRRVRIMEMVLFTTAATASSISCGTPANNNTMVATTSITPLPTILDNVTNDAAATAKLDTAWSTAPTVPGTFGEKLTLGATIGQGYVLKRVMDYKEPITLGFATNPQVLVVWNHGGSAGSALDMYVLLDE